MPHIYVLSLRVLEFKCVSLSNRNTSFTIESFAHFVNYSTVVGAVEFESTIIHVFSEHKQNGLLGCKFFFLQFCCFNRRDILLIVLHATACLALVWRMHFEQLRFPLSMYTSIVKPCHAMAKEHGVRAMGLWSFVNEFVSLRFIIFDRHAVIDVYRHQSFLLVGCFSFFFVWIFISNARSNLTS